MKLQDLFEMHGHLVHVDDEFSEMTFDFEFDTSYEDMQEVPEPLTLIVKVVTPIEHDYRGMAKGTLRQQYESSPELAYYVGNKSGKLYQQDLLNHPQTVFELKMSKEQLVSLLNQHKIHKSISPGTLEA